MVNRDFRSADLEFFEMASVIGQKSLIVLAGRDADHQVEVACHFSFGSKSSAFLAEEPTALFINANTVTHCKKSSRAFSFPSGVFGQ